MTQLPSGIPGTLTLGIQQPCCKEPRLYVEALGKCSGHLISQMTASINQLAEPTWLSDNHLAEPINPRTVRQKYKGSLF